MNYLAAENSNSACEEIASWQNRGVMKPFAGSSSASAHAVNRSRSDDRVLDTSFSNAGFMNFPEAYITKVCSRRRLTASGRDGRSRRPAPACHLRLPMSADRPPAGAEARRLNACARALRLPTSQVRNRRLLRRSYRVLCVTCQAYSSGTREASAAVWRPTQNPKTIPAAIASAADCHGLAFT